MEENNDNNQNNENVENVENVENNNIPSEELTIVEENSTEEEVETVNNIKIANDAVAMYVGIAIAEIPGVYGMSGALAGITEAISGKRNYTKGVKVDVNEKTVKIDVNIIVEYGARIPDVAFEIQTKVKKSVETMTGLKVSEVNVNVQGVHAITEKDEGKEEE
ncbi:MAG: Asp23/Gls24 family envelope stress response protein [Clostridia bacterium]|nr:Asp23/Gls24 family envelope stress response protein [Clostridia bacterium]